MLPGLTLPASWRVLLETFRPAFRRSSTFALFELLATGLGRACGQAHGGRHARRGGHGGGGVVPRVLSVLLAACLGCRSARPRAGAADRDQAARRGRADRGGRRRHPVPPLGPAGVRRVLDPRRFRAGPQRARARQPVDHRRDRRRVAVPLASGVPAGPVSALARRGHPVPGAAGWRDDFRSAAAVSGTNHPRRGRRRLPRQGAAGREHHVHHPAAGQRRAVRARAAAHRQTRPPPG